jgi:hypothetical protein
MKNKGQILVHKYTRETFNQKSKKEQKKVMKTRIMRRIIDSHTMEQGKGL